MTLQHEKMSVGDHHCPDPCWTLKQDFDSPLGTALSSSASLQKTEKTIEAKLWVDQETTEEDPYRLPLLCGNPLPPHHSDLHPSVLFAFSRPFFETQYTGHRTYYQKQLWLFDTAEGKKDLQKQSRH